jgi:hypothetical protein
MLTNHILASVNFYHLRITPAALKALFQIKKPLLFIATVLTRMIFYL